MRTSVSLLGAAILAALVLLPGCAGHRTPQVRPEAQGPALSPEGRVQYYYLIYQDQILRLQRLTRTQPLNQETLAQALGYQKTAVEALNRVLELQPAPELYVDKANLYWNNEQIGTARAIQVDQQSGAFAALAMSLNGLLTALLVPLLIPLLGSWLA